MRLHCKRLTDPRILPLVGLLISLLPAALPRPADAEGPPETGPNGFRLENLKVPREAIRSGGPPRDAIRSVDEPRFAGVDEARWVRGVDPVIGVARGGAAHAYPIHVMERHQVVNTLLGKTPIVATYDPLAGSPRAYERRIQVQDQDQDQDQVLDFGVAGLLYNANFLLYDRQTESLWVQFSGEAIAGPLAGQRLTRLRVHQEPLASWARRAPATRVLALPEPKRLDYRHSPFQRYWIQNRLPAPVKAEDPRFHAKELVLGVVVGDEVRAYLGSLLTAAGGRVKEKIGGHSVEIDYSSETGSFRFETRASPQELSIDESYWFAWKAFHSETGVWNDPGDIEPLPRD